MSWKRSVTRGVLLALVTPDWLREQVQPDWLERYGHRADEYRFPSGAEARQQFLQQVGQDGWNLLAALEAEPECHWMLKMPVIDPLQRVWEQHYVPLDQGGGWIAEADRVESAFLIHSPYDLDAKAAKKRSTFWVGDMCPFHRDL